MAVMAIALGFSSPEEDAPLERASLTPARLA
jgi:hypothetical protein